MPSELLLARESGSGYGGVCRVNSWEGTYRISVIRDRYSLILYILSVFIVGESVIGKVSLKFQKKCIGLYKSLNGLYVGTYIQLFCFKGKKGLNKF